MKKFLLALLVGCAVTQGAALAVERASVASVNGNIVLTLTGKSVQLTSSGMDVDPVLSPNGAMVVFTRKLAEKPVGSCEPAVSEKRELWLVGVDQKKKARRLLESKDAADPKDVLCDFALKQFTSDNRKVLFQTPAWVTSGALHEIDLTNGKQRYVLPSNGFRILTDCAMREYRDHLVVNQHRYFVFGGTYDWYWLFSRDGKTELGAVGEDATPLEEACDTDLVLGGRKAVQPATPGGTP
jgi:hypothetical protein